MGGPPEDCQRRLVKSGADWRRRRLSDMFSERMIESEGLRERWSVKVGVFWTLRRSKASKIHMDVTRRQVTRSVMRLGRHRGVGAPVAVHQKIVDVIRWRPSSPTALFGSTGLHLEARAALTHLPHQVRSLHRARLPALERATHVAIDLESGAAFAHLPHELRSLRRYRLPALEGSTHVAIDSKSCAKTHCAAMASAPPPPRERPARPALSKAARSDGSHLISTCPREHHRHPGVDAMASAPLAPRL